MTSTLWPRRPLPVVDGDIAAWDLTSLGQLPGVRVELREVLLDHADHPDGPAPVDALLLAFDELVSNGLRHGTGPVRARLVINSTGWLLDVSDQAAGRPPAPAVDRDPARGGLGLHLIARLTTAHGWTVSAGRKHVWAHLDRTGSMLPACG